MIVETGTGLPTANSYASLADANNFHSDRLTPEWAGTDAQKTAALIRATDSIDATYRFTGRKLTTAQALQNPRIVPAPASSPTSAFGFVYHGLTVDLTPSEIADTVVNPLVAKATFILAGKLLATATSDALAAREILSQQTTAGPATIITTYQAGRSFDPYPDVSNILAPITTGSGSSRVGTFAR